MEGVDWWSQTSEEDEDVLFGYLKGTVVGLRYYTGEVNQGEKVNLEREPYNPYDCNAVMVTNIYGEEVGHIKWKLAAAMAYVMDNDLAEVYGVEDYGKKNPYTMPLMLSFWGKKENKYDVIKSMADYGFKLTEMEVEHYDHNAETSSQTSEEDADVLFGHLKGTVVGLRYYTGEVNKGETVNLVRAPYNPHDCNAVMVTNIYDDHVGYIQWKLAAAMAYVMDNDLAEVYGVVHYGTKNRYSMPLTLSFWGKKENKYDVIESMADYGFNLTEMEPSSPQQYGRGGGYQAGGYVQPGNQGGSNQCYVCGGWGHWARDCQSQF